MKIHPDGTLEGTAEELAAYQGKIKANNTKDLFGHKPTWENPTMIDAHRRPLLGRLRNESCIYTAPRNPHVTVTFNQT